MNPLTYHTVRLLEASDIIMLMKELYGLDWEEASTALFGDTAGDARLCFGKTVRDGFTKIVTPESLRARKVNLSDIFCALSELGLLEPGRYVVRSSS